MTVTELANQFLHAKRTLCDCGELSPHTWEDYRIACEFVALTLGRQRPVASLTPRDFDMLREVFARRNGPHRVAKLVQITRTLFKYAFDAELVEKPVRTGPNFRRPSKAVFRRLKAEQGPRILRLPKFGPSWKRLARSCELSFYWGSTRHLATLTWAGLSFGTWTCPLPTAGRFWTSRDLG